ncbi:MAG: hypothetical protein FWD52_04035 [Candidatus Bathyarchaeota archaeon]|nr:hypothetical protein [Candidatus Termiticorpusculum sp.]
MLNRKINFLLIVMLIVAIIVPSQIGFVHSATGAIRVNSTTTSVSNQQVIAGDNVNLYFGDSSIKWAGHNFYLLLSRDLATTFSTGDHVYSPMFSVAALQDSSVKYYSNNEGAWVIGNNWVNGTFASNMATGRYSVKAFDFSSAGTETDTNTVAVTDTFITVNTPPPGQFTFQITPNEGPGGVPVQFSGSGYPPNTAIDIAYYDQAYLEYRAWKRETTNASGSFSFTAAIPDLGKSNQQGDTPETFNRVQFKTQHQGLTYNFATYDQYARGIKSIGDHSAYGLYGNGSNLVSTFKAKAGDTFTITGKWFHQGVVYVLLDSVTVMGTVTRNQWSNDAIQIGSGITNSLGHFEATVTIPKATSGGEHYISIEDAQSSLILKILITDGTFEISPSSGSGGANIQFTGSGYPPLRDVDITYRDGLYGSWNYWTTVEADATGNINVDAKIPDLKKNGYAGDYDPISSQIMFRTESNDKIYAYATYTQYARGLKQVGSQTATGLYGGSTNFANYGMKVKPGDTLTISGHYFHPGVIYVRWDGQAVVNTVTPDQWTTAEKIGNTITNAQGSFDITIQIPQANNGLHWVSIEDSQTNFIIRLLVETPTTPTPSPSPSPSTDTGSPSTPKPSPSPSTPPSTDKPTPAINLQCKSVPIDAGYRVEISGTCSNNNAGIANKAIQLYNSKDGGKTWEPLSLVTTNNEGKFNAVWVSLTSGTFLIKAECTATTEYNSATATVNVVIEPILGNNHNGVNVFTLTSNSTISQLVFNSKNSELSFTASGTSGSTGYVSVNIPKTLINDLTNLKVYLDGKELAYSNNSQEPDTWIITITYTHSTHTITLNFNNTQNQNLQPTQIIIIAAIIIIGITIATVAITRTQKKKPQKQN